MVRAPSRSATVARSVDVSTSPGMSLLIARTPCGRATSSARARWVAAALQAFAGNVASGRRQARPGSAVRISSATAASSCSTPASRAARAAAATTTVARASRGIALCLSPPLSVATRTSTPARRTCHSARARTFTALARWRWMSTPECPPFKPLTSTWIATSPSAFAASSSGRVSTLPAPPAQPTVIVPSSSESRLSSRRPWSMSAAIWLAPVRPVSSSIVNSSSSGGCAGPGGEVGLGEGEHRRHADAVVGAEGRARRLQILPHHPRPDGVAVEVVRDVGVLLVDHVEVRLQHDRRRLLAAARRRHQDHHVAGVVTAVGQAASRCHRQHVATHALLVARATGDSEDVIEVAPQRPRLELRNEGHDQSPRERKRTV